MRWFKVLMLLLVFFALKQFGAANTITDPTNDQVAQEEYRGNKQPQFPSFASKGTNKSSDYDEVKINENKKWEREIQEQMAHYAKLQYYVGLGSLVGLGFTVVFAAIAAHAAWRSVAQAKNSAAAAWETVALTKDNNKKQLRAYVGLKSAFVSDQTPKDLIIFEFKIANNGQTPAMVTRVSLLGVVGKEPLRPEDFEKSLVYDLSIYLAPNEIYVGHAPITRNVPSDIENKISNGILSAHVRIEVNYSDIFEEQHTGVFVRSIQGKDFRFWGAAMHVNPDYPDKFT